MEEVLDAVDSFEQSLKKGKKRKKKIHGNAFKNSGGSGL